MIQVVDFFCGCGGTSAGFRKAGMKILAGIDFNADAGATFKNNFPDASFFNEDIRKFPTLSLTHIIPRERLVPLLFSACAPCQPFSKQKTTRKKIDNRITLLDELHRFIRRFRPEYIFLENVPGLQNVTTDNGPLGRFIKLLEQLDYRFVVSLLRSQDYGVPQYRKRLVVIASLIDDLTMPCTTHGNKAETKPYESVWNWIKDLPPIMAGESHPQFKNHRAADLSSTNLERIKATPEGGGRLDWPKHLRLDCHNDYSGHTDVYGRLHKLRPAAALTTRCISLSNGRYGHPTQNRAISVREAARLQTFPDDFEFSGSLNSMAVQIGNAVPARLAETFGNHFQAHFQNSPHIQCEK